MRPGDKIRIICADKTHEGILIDEKKEVTVIKLENGYNIGIENKKIKKTEVLEKGKELEIKYAPDRQKKEGNEKGLPKIAILHTGGTIASKVDYRTGAVYSSFRPEDLLGLFPELGDIARFDSRLIANMWSEDLRFRHFSVIAEAVAEEVKKGAEGVIIGIGTDNLAVAAAGVSFAIEKCPVPVIFVGAQRSSDRGSSDAAMNLVCAAEFIVKSDFAGVAICMHDYMSDERCAILPACKTKKLHSSRRDAFKAVNDFPIAYVDYRTRNIQLKKTDYAKKDQKDQKNNIVIKPRFEEKTGLVKMHVNFFAKQLDCFKNYKGLVIEGMGLGQIPGEVTNEWSTDNKDIFPAIKSLVDSGCIVVMTTNCIFGRVNLNVYSKGRDILALGVVAGEDMLAETALVKLAWLLGNYTPDKAKSLVGINLRGEINERINEKEFLE
jgi:glutamyl-tRNA(Gln) amidotransferase subunit D